MEIKKIQEVKKEMIADLLTRLITLTDFVTLQSALINILTYYSIHSMPLVAA